MKTIKKLLVTATVIVSLISANEVMAAKPKPYNRIVAVIDASGTFRNHQFEAIQKVQWLMDGIAETKDHRYQSPDEVYLISLDSRPEVIWYGKKHQLDQLSEERLLELFGKRRAYSACTDIAKAFNLATQKLNREPSPAAKYLFVFSDLIDEPTVAVKSGCKAPSRPSLPPDDIRWDRLTDTSINVFWAPDGQIEAWESTLVDLATINFYNEAEAQNVEPPVPAKARFKMTEEERAEKLDKLNGVAAGLWGLLISFLKYATIIAGAVFVLIYFRNRNGRGTHGTGNGSGNRGNAQRQNSKAGR